MTTNSPLSQKPNSFLGFLKWFSGLLILLFILSLIGGFITAAYEGYLQRHQPLNGHLQELSDAEVSSLTKDQVAEVLNPKSKLTSLQREGVIKSLTGKVIVWDLTVENVERSGRSYLLTNDPGIKFSIFGHHSNNLDAITLLSPRSKEEDLKIKGLKPNESVTIKAIIQGNYGNVLRLEPAILYVETAAKPMPLPIPNSTLTKILSKDEVEEANDHARSVAHDKAQGENLKQLMAAGELPNINNPNSFKPIDISPYVNRFNADCASSKQRDAITLGGLNEKEAVKLATETCRESLPKFSQCIAKQGTTYKSCYSVSILSAE